MPCTTASADAGYEDNTGEQRKFPQSSTNLKGIVCVLTEASINGSIDTLRGLKENVIVASFPPAPAWVLPQRPALSRARRSGGPGPAGVTAGIEAEKRELEQMRREGEQEKLAAEYVLRTVLDASHTNKQRLSFGSEVSS